MEAKYICGELPGPVGKVYGAVIFPAFMDHYTVARSLGIEAKSAGMCTKDAEGKWCAYGKSVGLKLQAAEADDFELNKLGD